MLDRKPLLLLVDDDAHVSRAFARVLSRHFIIEAVSDAARALRRIAHGPAFDAILCDRDLPDGVSGQDLFDSLPLELQRRTVMCSGHEPERDDAFVAVLGERYFLKAGDVGTLISILLSAARTPILAVA